MLVSWIFVGQVFLEDSWICDTLDVPYQSVSAYSLFVWDSTYWFSFYFLFLVSAAGVPIKKVTPEGLIFVTQWVIVVLIGYWLLSLAFQLVTSTLRRALWLLKVGVAMACFGFILSDRSVDTETMAIRLAVLVLVCVLLGVGTSSGSSVADRSAHLEEQVRTLERRLREMERWRRTEEWRSLHGAPCRRDGAAAVLH